MKIKNKEAVSPVIGVILMVAITVVLAAVLYVWASSFVQTTGNTPRATHKLENPNNDYAVTLTSVVPKADLVEITMMLKTATGMTKWRAESIDLYDFGQWTDDGATADVVDVGEDVALLPPNIREEPGDEYDYALPSDEYAWGGYMYSDDGALQTNVLTFWNTYTNILGPDDTDGIAPANAGQVIFVNNDAGSEVADLVVDATDPLTVTPTGTFKLSANDQYFVRSQTNSGSAQAGDRFQLIFDPTEEVILDVPL